MSDDPPAGGDAGQTTHLVMAGDPLAVREGLRTLFGLPMLRSLPGEDQGKVEIVLAEVLNNVVEHAYATKAGVIEVTLHLGDAGLLCRIVDSGAPLPGLRLPAGGLPRTGTGGDMPEGGFGWHLIRTLSQDLSYRRIGRRNLLSFRLNTHQSG